MRAPAQEKPAPAAPGEGRSRELLNLLTHNQYHTAAVSADGKLIAAGNRRNQVVVWDANSGQEVAVFTGQRGEVIDVAFSPDGKWLASSGRDGARVWNIASGNESFAITNKGWLSRVAFSPDSRRLAAVGSSVVLLWDVSNGQEIRVARSSAGSQSSVVFRPDGKVMATASTDRTIRLWDVANGHELLLLREHTSAVHALAFSPDGQRFASASLDKTVRVYDAESGTALFKIAAHPTGVHAVAFSPDGRRLATGGVDRTVKLWDARSGEELLTLQGHTGPVFSVAFHPDGLRLVSTANDATVRMWDLVGLARSPAPLLGCELEALWLELASDNPATAFRAAYTLAGAPEQAVAFLKPRLKPAQILPEEAERLGQLIADLDASQFAARQRATHELAKLGRSAELALRRALEERPPLEVRQRLERLLVQLRTAPPSPEQLLADRSVEVLERIGTTEAQALLESLAKGNPQSWLTREAKAALSRLNRSGSATGK
jgi:hypothetical protein